MPAPMEIWECPHCGTRLDVAALGFCAEVECPQCAQRASVHMLLANFKLERVLGIGGMSEVFKAHDMVLGRPLAIKVLNSAYRNEPERIARFEAECSLMAKVRHENVVSVYSAGWAREQFYIAMELIEGRNLESIVTEQKCLLPPKALEMTRQTALGLRAAHQAGVLHRDVKPGNVIVTPEGIAKVLDFGLSHDAGEGEEQEGVIWATPFYVPPETLRREPEDVRADIYALGMMLRNLLTGEDKLRDPVDGISSLLAAKRRLPTMRESYPNLEEALSELVDHMTAFDPADRPANYDEVLEEIAEVKTRMGGISPREMGREQRRRRMLFARSLGAAAVVGFLAAVPVAFLCAPVERIQASVRAAAQPEWADYALWHAAMESLAANDLVGAGEKLRALMTEGKDEALISAAEQQVMALAFLTGKEDEIDSVFSGKAEERAATLQKEKLCLSSGEQAAAPLRAATKILAASDAAEQADAEQAAALLQEAHAALNAAGFREVAELADTARHNLPRTMAQAGRNRVRHAMYAGNFAAAHAGLESLKGAKLTALQQEECRVQAEVCDAAAALYALLNRRSGGKFNPADDMEKQGILLASLSLGNKFKSEATALILMMHGDYAKAFAADPYRNDAASQEPFAVIMRDWRKRLGFK